jgi:hypothetical protein
MLSVCLCIPPINFSMAQPIFMKFGMHIMAPEPISTAYFIIPLITLCVYVCVCVSTYPCQARVQ